MAATFTVLDFCLFIAVLVISALIGVYYMLKERWRAAEVTAEDILMGNREMGVFPVAISLLASYMSAITVLGIPTEMYVYGVSYWLVAAAGFMTFPLTCFLFLPFFHNLQLSSAYEYLELRFSRLTRFLASGIFVIQMFLYLAVVLYAPALALNEVTGFSLFGSILAVGAVVTFYTSMGGLRAVLWTDTFQTFVVVAGLFGVVIIGSNKVGGVERVWEISTAGGRTEFLNFNPSPFQRTTFFGVTLGSFVGQMTIYGASQTMLQRYMSIQNVRSSQLALFISLPATTLLVSLVCVSGLVIYATYHDCDPLLSGDLISRDQLLPYFVMENLGTYQGVPGLFVSCIFAAALSSISSCLNALSITILEDFIKPCMSNQKISPKLEAFLAKAIGVVSGLIIIVLAFSCYFIGNTVLQIMLTALGAGGGPLLGLFILGMFFPCVNSFGATSALIVSTVVTFWIAIGAIVKQVPQPTLPFSVEGCQADKNISQIFNDILSLHEITPATQAPSGISEFYEAGAFDVIYKLSFLWYPTLAVFVALIVGILASAATSWTERDSIESRLLYPVHKKLCCFLPMVIRKKLNCAVLWTESMKNRNSDGFFEDSESEDETLTVKSSETAHLLGGEEGNQDENDDDKNSSNNDGLPMDFETRI